MEKTERDLNQRLQEESRLVVALRHEVKEQEELINNIEELQAENSRLTAENRRIKVSRAAVKSINKKLLINLVFATIYTVCNAMDNQRIIQSTTAIFFISVLNHGCCDYSRKSAKHVLASHLRVNSSSVRRR
jgi:hypothetical protein